jgi:uncharacterized protein DUF4169
MGDIVNLRRVRKQRARRRNEDDAHRREVAGDRAE